MVSRTKYISGEFTLTDHDEIQLMAPAELLNYDLAAADVPIAREIISYVGGNTRS